MTSVEPGWYHAEGDPPGSHRYWDGTQWQGGPSFAGGGPQAVSSRFVPARRGTRIVAWLIDSFLAFGVFVIGALLAWGGFALSDPLGYGLGIIGLLAAIGFSIYNYLYLQGTRGQTIGKAQRDIMLIRLEDGAPVGVAMTLLRYFLSSLIDQVCLIDTLWILFDDDGQRLSDKLLKFNVVEAPQQ